MSVPPPEETKATSDPLLDLIARVPREARALAEAEVALASAEIRRNLIGLALAFAFILAGGIILGIAGISLLGALIAALAPVVGPVWSAVLTAATALVAGGGLMIVGIRRLHHGPLAPRQTMANLKASLESLKRQPDGTSKE
ncbi:MAG: phage holin family protein [Polymorphobacter sp.]|uniref:phage holin family protein n=1 Tax=Polymorphobacter sp. TaxID=1909290 RepID=UPI003A8824B2